MIYLDNMASTPLDPKVRAAMDEILDEGPGNPHATTHAPGWRAAAHVDEARRDIARLIGASPAEIVFVSGATEANNLAIKGAIEGGSPASLVHSAIEHPSVVAVAEALAAKGCTVRSAPVDAEGIVDLAVLSDMVDETVSLVSIMLANNETGAVQPVAEIAELCRSKGTLLHCDAAQAPGRLKIDVGELGVDFLSLSAHKVYGPMGVGALYVREGTRLAPQIHGGSQQGGLRAGTVPVPLVHGMAAAARIAEAELESDARRLGEYSDSLYERLKNAVPGLVLNGPECGRLPGCLNVSFPGTDAEDLLLACPGLAAATGAACASGDQRPSHVLAAMGALPERIAGSVRLSFGRFNTDADVRGAGESLLKALGEVAPQSLAGTGPASAQGGTGV